MTRMAVRGDGRSAIKIMLALFLIAAGLAATPAARASEGPQKFVVHEAPKALPEIKFQDADGHDRSLADFHGKVVLLNVWATWCAPCRREMPTLDRLQAALGGQDFEVVALSIDRAGMGAVTKFYGEVGMKHLAKYIDTSGKAARELGAVGLPTTILIDRDGREAGRLTGPAEWDASDMVKFIRNRLAKKSAWPMPPMLRQAAETHVRLGPGFLAAGTIASHETAKGTHS